MNKAKRDQLIQTLIEVAKLAGKDISRDQIRDDCLDGPHRRPPEDRSPVIYVFALFGKPLKIGKSFAKRGTRLGSHYNPDANSPLAKAILECKDGIKQMCPQEMHAEINDLGKECVGSWMQKYLTLTRLRFDGAIEPMVVELFEVLLQCKLCPLFEGTSRGHGSLKKLQSIDPRALDRLAGLYKLG
ncbi:MAG TPA: hypothetical protein VMP11_20970 [Verrucomicrobiae bacterium]|nr:hypothetical protein [Verrucomicrobiae bacterium]